MPTTAALRSTICLGMIAAGLTLAAGTASAHVGISEDEVEAGSYAVLTFGLPHGCGQSPVTELRIQIPEPILSVTPTRNANWEVTKVMTELDEPVGVAAHHPDVAPHPDARLQIERRGGEVRIGKEHLERGIEWRHHVRRAERSTCGRVQIGSGLLSISRRTHSSRSRSGIMRA